MATRRSARLRGQTPAIETVNLDSMRSPTKSTAKKSDDPSVETAKRLASAPSTPKANPSISMATSTLSSASKVRTHFKTPENHVAAKPSLGEMHPSKVQQSTTKQPDTGLRLGFRPIQDESRDPTRSAPSFINTPSKGRVSNADELKNMSFDFQFSGDSQLSQEAKKLMESLREEAARIKSKLLIEKKAQEQKDEEAGDERLTVRKIAKPKGIAGRYSAAHMAQFKKMDSIAGHPSAFRTRLETSQLSPTKSLKRKSSTAQLGEPEKSVPVKTRATPASRAVSSSHSVPQRAPYGSVSSSTFTRVPLSGGTQTQNRSPPKPAGFDKSKFMTPQKPSIPRSPSLKQPHTVKVAPIPRSPSCKSFMTAKTPQTDLKYKSKMPKLKSILRQPQPLFSDDLEKIAAGTHQPLCRQDFDSKLLGLSKDIKPSLLATPLRKTVDFSASTKLRDACNEASPSTIASKAQASGPREIIYPTLPPTTPPHERRVPGFTFRIQSPSTREATSPPKMPPCPGRSFIPHGIINKKRRREDADGSEDPQTPQNDRFIKRLKHNPPTPSVMQTPSPVKRRLPATVTPRRGTPSRETPRGKGLTLSRLNFLATPKIRRGT